jgi:hypothetical protein
MPKGGEPSGMDPETKQRLVRDQARIEQLRQQVKQAPSELLPEVNEFDVIQEQFKNKDRKQMTQEMLSQIEAKNKDNPQKLAQDLTAVRSHLEQEIHSSVPGAKGRPLPLERASLQDRQMKAPAIGSLSQLPGYGKQSKQPIKTKPPVAPPEEEQSKTPYSPQKPSSPQRYPPPEHGHSQYYPYAPPMPAQVQAQVQAPPPSWASAYNPVPQPQASVVDPLLLHNLNEIKEKIAQTLAKNKTLETELQKLKDKAQEEKPPEDKALRPETKKSTLKGGEGDKKDPGRKEINLPNPIGMLTEHNRRIYVCTERTAGGGSGGRGEGAVELGGARVRRSADAIAP